MTNDNDVKTILISLASYQDSLLQSYRAVFISSQTILISIAALIASLSYSSVKLFVLFLFIIGGILLVLWILICHIRGLDTSYFQLQLEMLEKGELEDKQIIWTSFINWRSKWPWEKEKIFKNSNKKALKEFTRLSLGIFLPLVYLSLWLIILFITV